MPQKNAKAMGKVVTTSPLNSDNRIGDDANAVARPEQIRESPAGVQLGLAWDGKYDRLLPAFPSLPATQFRPHPSHTRSAAAARTPRCGH